MSFVSSGHNPKIMLGMLVKVLCSNLIATRRRLSREGNVAFEDLMRGASDFDVRTVTFKILTSVRYRLPMTVGIVTVITTIRSVGLSCSHEAFCINGEVRSQSNESVSECLPSEGVAPLFSTGQFFRTLEGVVLVSNSFLVQCLAETGLTGAVSLFKRHRIKNLVGAAILQLRCAYTLRAAIW